MILAGDTRSAISLGCPTNCDPETLGGLFSVRRQDGLMGPCCRNPLRGQGHQSVCRLGGERFERYDSLVIVRIPSPSIPGYSSSGGEGRNHGAPCFFNATIHQIKDCPGPLGDAREHQRQTARQPWRAGVPQCASEPVAGGTYWFTKADGSRSLLIRHKCCPASTGPQNGSPKVPILARSAVWNPDSIQWSWII